MACMITLEKLLGELSPLQLVARAKISLVTVGTKSGPVCARLLDVCKT